MKIAIIGAGAMGSVYAGLLADAGNDVAVVDIWAAHINAIRADGLRVEGASGDRVVRTLHAVTDVSDLEPCDLVIIATKASGVASAARAIGPILHHDTLVLTIQNGLGAGERICESLPPDNVLLGVAGGFGASIKGPGHAHHNGMELIRIGEMQGGLTPRVEQVASVWRGAGFNVKSFADINQLIWEKFICNVTFSAPCTVFGRTIGEMMADPYSWKISLTCGLEAYTVARAKNIALSFDDTEEYVCAFGSKMPNARPSMLLDHLASRPSEIDAINGMVPVVAAEAGLEAPYNEVLTAMVKSKEAEF
ncbi:MAG: 2-dehydropantoate 2-reductase [Gammaproteobacteria bacterium]|nr:2-dehydropantoate 2-reductase [Gammaproteobacteria bacterium]